MLRRIFKGKSPTPTEWPDPKTVPKVPYKGQKISAFIYDVYDGDTCSILIRHGTEYLNLKIRVLGVDTPEVTIRGINTPRDDLEEEVGKFVRDKVKDLIEGKECEVILKKWDKYGGRVIGEIYISEDQTLTQYLLDNNFAKPYDGGTKSVWTISQLEEILRSE